MNVMIKRIRISEKPTKYEWAHNRNGYLSFSSECVELPEHIVEVLVVHEMTHMFSSYHDDLFYRKFEEFLPGARVRDDEINLYVGCSSVVEEMKVYR